MAQEKPTVSTMIDTINATLVEANKLLTSGSPGGFKLGIEGLQIATASMQVLIEKRTLLLPEDYKRVFGKDHPV